MAEARNIANTNLIDNRERLGNHRHDRDNSLDCNRKRMAFEATANGSTEPHLEFAVNGETRVLEHTGSGREPMADSVEAIHDLADSELNPVIARQAETDCVSSRKPPLD